jgi:hypothetical protein
MRYYDADGGVILARAARGPNQCPIVAGVQMRRVARNYV